MKISSLNGSLFYKTKSKTSSAAVFCSKPVSLQSSKVGNEINGFTNKYLVNFSGKVNQTEKVNPNIRLAMKNFFSNSNKEIENTLKNTDFTVWGKSGIPLEYTRQMFIEDLDKQVKETGWSKSYDILSKAGIYPLKNYNTGEITGFEGVVSTKNLGTKDEDEAKFYALADKFINKNSVKTDNPQLNLALNSLIKGMPEFLSVIGKPQHESHEFSVDLHILNVLQKSLSNPNYEKLSDYDKTCLKFAIMMHDIAKPEKLNDPFHPVKSAEYAEDILSNYNFPAGTKKEIHDLIRNHHWLAGYNNGIYSPENIAVIFRKNNDIEVARIFAEADLKGIDKGMSFYYCFGNALSDGFQSPIDEAVKSINQTGQLIHTDKIFNKSNIPTIEHNGEAYRVIDVPNLTEEQTASIFLTSKPPVGLNYAVYRFNNQDEFNEKAQKMIDSSKQFSHNETLPLKYISAENKNGIDGKTFGLCFDIAPENTLGVFDEQDKPDLGSYFQDTLNPNKEYYLECRKPLSDSIKQELDLSDEEYFELYSFITKQSSLDKLFCGQNKADKFVNIRDKKISYQSISNAIKKSNDKILSEEKAVYVFNPQVSGITANVYDISEIPNSILKIASDNDLPVILLGAGKNN